MPATEIIVRDLGLVNYRQAYLEQESLFSESLRCKKAIREGHPGTPPPENHLLFCEHPHVFTIGKSGRPDNLLVSEAYLRSIGAICIRTNRGGDITYHGPGQIVGYPILDLEQFGLSLKEYVHLIEESIILFLDIYGLKATRLSGATGVWLDAHTARVRKICAIGIRASRSVTMHGFALNVDPDLKYYKYINPCGFTDKGVTSMMAERPSVYRRQEMIRLLAEKITASLGIAP